MPKPQTFDDPEVSVQLRVAIVSRAERVVDVLIDNDLVDMISGRLGIFKRMGPKYFGAVILSTKSTRAVFFGPALDVRASFYPAKLKSAHR